MWHDIVSHQTIMISVFDTDTFALKMWTWMAGGLSCSKEQTLVWARSVWLHGWDWSSHDAWWKTKAKICSLFFKDQPAWNNDFIWNMRHAQEFGFEWWAGIFVWSYSVFQPSVHKLPLSCNFWNKFLCSVWSSPYCIKKKKKKLNTGTYSAKNNPCSCTAWALWVSCSLKIFIQFLKEKYPLSSSHGGGY